MTLHGTLKQVNQFSATFVKMILSSIKRVGLRGVLKSSTAKLYFAEISCVRKMNE